MKTNDRIIWDSGFGYEIGYFKGDGIFDHTVKVDMVTGICTGHVSHSKHEIKPYSEELVQQLTERYGYEKSFSEDF